MAQSPGHGTSPNAMLFCGSASRAAQALRSVRAYLTSQMRYVAAIVAVIAILLAVVVMRLSGRSGGFVTLSNGMQVHYLGNAVGTATFSTEKQWHKLARRFLPRPLQRILPAAQTGSCSSSTNSITLYFKVTDPSGATIRLTPWEHYIAGDDDGFRYPREGGYCSFGGVSNTLIYGLITRAFPRRQASFDFKFLGPKDEILGAFRIPNPVRGPFPEWTPHPLPQAQTNGPVTLTLLALGAGKNGWSEYTHPKWTIGASDPLWAKARAQYVTLSDATGNEAQMLSRREHAWKVTAFVHRSGPEDFTAADRLVATNIAIPNPGEFVAVDQSAEKNGVTLKLLVVAGPGKLMISNGVHRVMRPTTEPQSGHSTSQSSTDYTETWASPKHFLLLEASNVLTDDEIRIYVTDDAGRTLELKESGYHGGPGGRIYQRAFTPSPEAKALNVTVVVSRPLKFEFLVDPKECSEKVNR